MKLKLNTKLPKISALLALVYVASNNVVGAVAGVGNGASSARGADQPVDLFGDGGTFSTITNVLLFIVGAIAVIMIVIGGLRYVLSGGDSNQITAAKNTILYAIIGIIVAILAYAIVRFIVGSFVVGGTGGTDV
jgi:hypothetical protein